MSARGPQTDRSDEEWSEARVEAERVARFDKLETDAKLFLDSDLPGHIRENYNVVGLGITEKKGVTPVVSDTDGFDFNVVYMTSAPGEGPGMHSHDHIEVFMALTGRWEVRWGVDDENGVILEPWDLVSVPPGVMRRIFNAGDEDAWLCTFLCGHGSLNKVT